MLVLSRFTGQRIFIGRDRKTWFRVTNVNRETGEVRIAIEAPKHIDILREEIFNKDYGRDLSTESVDNTVKNKPKIKFKRVKPWSNREE